MDMGKLILGAGLGGGMFAIALVALLDPPTSTMRSHSFPADREDPLQSELARCRDISAPDSGCSHAWVAHRTRFLGRDRSGK